MKIIRNLIFVVLLFINFHTVKGNIIQGKVNNNVLTKEILWSDYDTESSINDWFSNTLGSANVPGGFIEVTDCYEFKKYKFTPKNHSLEEMLNSIVEQNPANIWIMKDNVINLLPLNGIPDVLNITIDEFKFENAKYVFEPINKLFDKKEIKDSLNKMEKLDVLVLYTGGTRNRENSFKIHCENMKVYEVLNEIVKEDEHAIWYYHEDRCNNKISYYFGLIRQ